MGGMYIAIFTHGYVPTTYLQLTKAKALDTTLQGIPSNMQQ